MKIVRLTLFLFLIFSVNSFALPNYKNITLVEFADDVSKSNHINIFIDEDLNATKINFYVPVLHDAKNLLDAFKISIEKKGLRLFKKNNFYYLSKKKEYRIKNYMFKLSYNCSEDFEKYLKMMQYQFIYLKSNNTFIVKCNYKQNQDIKSFLKTLDKQASQILLKFIILSYDDSLINEHGLQYATIYKSLDNTIQVALNTLLFPFNSKTNIVSSTAFYGALRFLDSDKSIQINQYPYVIVKNNNPFKFESVQNIPYLVKNTETDSNTVQNNNSFEYKDVGLKIHGVSQIYDDFITLDLDLTIEDLINTTTDNLTPSTNKRYLNTITNLKYDEVLVLSGIKQKKEDITDIKIPFLSGIPFLGKMFEYSYKNESMSNISIAIQVIRSGVEAEAKATLSAGEGRASDKER